MNWEELLPYWPALAILGVLILVGAAVYLWTRKRPTAAELERRRRETIHGIGRMSGGTITEVQQSFVFYNYLVRGMEYQASQDVTGLETYLPAGWSGAIGAVGVKYDPRNPANSIVVSEHWSGLRKTSTKN